MIVFDSGIDVYPEGETHMLPLLTKAFKDTGLIKSHAELGKACVQHRYVASSEPIGIQYSGGRKFKDAFCQIWSIWFLCNFIKQKRLIRKVCKTHPSNREVFLIKDFILPTLETHPDWAQRILEDHSDDLYSLFFQGDVVSTTEEFLDALRTYSNACKTKICQGNKQSMVCLMNTLK